MRALVYESFAGPMTVREEPAPAVPRGGVVIRVGASGICRSDWHGWQGHDPDIALPHVPGHELAGTVESVGPDVRGWQVGARVTVPFVCGCGRCDRCAAGDQQVCEHQTQPGFTHWGSFAERVAVEAADVNLVASAGRAVLRGRRQPGLPLRHRLPCGGAPGQGAPGGVGRGARLRRGRPVRDPGRRGGGRPGGGRRHRPRRARAGPRARRTGGRRLPWAGQCGRGGGRARADRGGSAPVTGRPRQPRHLHRLGVLPAGAGPPRAGRPAAAGAGAPGGADGPGRRPRARAAAAATACRHTPIPRCSA